MPRIPVNTEMNPDSYLVRSARYHSKGIPALRRRDLSTRRSILRWGSTTSTIYANLNGGPRAPTMPRIPVNTEMNPDSYQLGMETPMDKVLIVRSARYHSKGIPALRRRDLSTRRS
jgi:hypothetical protein